MRETTHEPTKKKRAGQKMEKKKSTPFWLRGPQAITEGEEEVRQGTEGDLNSRKEESTKNRGGK